MSDKLSKGLSKKQLRDLHDRIDQLAAFHQSLVSVDNAQQIIKLFCESVCRIMGVKYAVLAIVKENGKIIEHIATYSSNAKSSKKIKILKLKKDSINKILDSRNVLNFMNTLATAIYTKTKLYGFFYVTDKLDRSAFNEFDILVMNMLAIQMALIYENNQLQEVIHKQENIINKAILSRILTKRQMKNTAEKDSLTGLLNRVTLEKRLNEMIANNPNKKLIIISIDAGKLKIINQEISYYAGNKLIKIIANKLKKSITNKNILLSRIDGDRFLFILRGKKNKKYITDYVEKLVDFINETIIINDEKIHIRASVGISIYPHDGRDSVTCLKNTDAALNFIKEKGGNYLQFYHPTIPLKVAEKFTLVNELREALTKKQFILHYQPKVDLKTRKVIGLEALLRWQHPKKGLLYPATFISIAEETNLIVPISEWVIREIFQAIASRKMKVPVAINLSIVQLRQQYNLVGYIKKLMKEFHVSGDKLEYEITENMMMLTEKNSISVLNELKKLGGEICFDDFGSGYSSFSYLKYFIPNKIKIDKSFIDAIPNDHTTLKLIEAMILLAHTLNIKVIAEGVTSIKKIKTLDKYGCDQLQGHYFSRALPLKEIILFLKNEVKFKR